MGFSYARKSSNDRFNNREPDSRFACNAVVVGSTVVLNTGCPELEEQLQARGYATRAVDLSEFMKSGGSAKCLTLALD